MKKITLLILLIITIAGVSAEESILEVNDKIGSFEIVWDGTTFELDRDEELTLGPYKIIGDERPDDYLLEIYHEDNLILSRESTEEIGDLAFEPDFVGGEDFKIEDGEIIDNKPDNEPTSQEPPEEPETTSNECEIDSGHKYNPGHNKCYFEIEMDTCDPEYFRTKEECEDAKVIDETKLFEEPEVETCPANNAFIHKEGKCFYEDKLSCEDITKYDTLEECRQANCLVTFEGFDKDSTGTCSWKQVKGCTNPLFATKQECDAANCNLVFEGLVYDEEKNDCIYQQTTACTNPFTFTTSEAEKCRDVNKKKSSGNETELHEKSYGEFVDGIIDMLPGESRKEQFYWFIGIVGVGAIFILKR